MFLNRSILFLFIISCFQLSGQKDKFQGKIDSLTRVINSSAADTVKAYAMSDLSRYYIKLRDTVLLKKLVEDLEDLYLGKKDQVVGSWYYFTLSMIEEKITFNNEEFLRYLLLSAECCKKSGNSVRYATRLQKAGTVEIRLGRWSEATDHIFQALEINNRAKQPVAASYCYFALGEIFRMEKNNGKALKMYREGFALALANGDYAGIHSGCVNIGLMYDHSNNLDSSFHYYKKALELALKNGRKKDIADGYQRLAAAYSNQKEYDLSVETSLKSIAMQEDIGDLRGITISNLKLADTYRRMRLYDKAHECVTKALTEAKKMKELSVMEGCYKLRGFIFEGQKKYHESLEAFFDYMVIHDSLITSSNNEQTAALESKFHNEQKEKEIQLLNKDKAIQEADIKKQKQFSYFVIAIAALLAATVFFIFRGLRQKARDNKALQEKNSIIAHQKELVEEKQKEILDSIYYARRIQRAQIPSEKQMAKALDRLRK